MEYYKVLKNGKPIDVLERVHYLKWNEPTNRFYNATKEDAQAIKSSDGKKVWHEITLRSIPIEGYDNVELCAINESEYRRLKFEFCYDINEFLDQYTLLLIERGVL